MGQRSPTETIFGIIAAFVDRPTWTQAELARRLETRSETIRKRLGELQASGFRLERQDDHPHVYWSVPKSWFPGALVLKSEEVTELLRLMRRAPRGPLRTRLLDLVVTRLAHAHPGFDREAVQAPAVADEEERWLALVEDAASKRVALKMRYFGASRRRESRRYVSVHRVVVGAHPHVIATCHEAGALRRFRLTGISEARLDPAEPFRSVTAKQLARFEEESLGGFHEPGPVVTCSFVVRDDEAAWVARNLPEGKITQEPRPEGMRFRIETTAVTLLARFVVGLGAAARAETPLLAKEVAAIARAALANQT